MPSVLDSPKCPIHHPPTPPPPFQFFALPPEIRNQIITHVVTEVFPITIKWKGFNRHVKAQPKIYTAPAMTASEQLIHPDEEPSDTEVSLGHSRIALLMTCKQAYREGWKIYYGNNTFDFSFHTFRPFCDEIPARCRNQIRSILFRMPFRYRHETIWQMLARFGRLENLEIQLHAPSTAQHSEWENCRSGAKEIKRLQILTLMRKGYSGEWTAQELSVLEKDQEIQDEINAYLRDRERLGSWDKKSLVVKVDSS